MASAGEALPQRREPVLPSRDRSVGRAAVFGEEQPAARWGWRTSGEVVVHDFAKPERDICDYMSRRSFPAIGSITKSVR
jgi:hypothetical protein